MISDAKDDHTEDEAANWGLFSRRLWSGACAVITVGLWLQWLAPGLVAELQSEDGSELIVAAQLLPLATALPAVLWHHPAGRLALFPLSFLPGLALLPRAEWEALSSPGSLVLAGVTFAVYLAVAAARPSDLPDRPGADYRDSPLNSDTGRGAFSWFLLTRFGVVGAVFVVVTYALFFDPAVAGALEEIEDDTARRTHHLFMAVTAYLSWMAVMYVGAVLPSVNWEHHRQSGVLSPRQRQLLRRPARLGRRVLGWLAAAVVVTVVLFWAPGWL